MNSPLFPQKVYAGLIFDCDGTLTDSMPIHFIAWRETMARYGIDFPESRFYALAGMPTYRIISMLAAEQGIQVDVRQVAAEKESAFIQNMHGLKAIDEVVAVAQHFRGQTPMAVASGGYREIILQQLKHIGCRDWFDAIITAEDTLKHKPEPEVFLTAAARLCVPPAQCLVYEDADLGVQAALAAGMDCIDIRKLLSAANGGAH